MSKDLPSPNAPNFGNRVREEIHRLLGKFGGFDRALTLRDAIDAGVISPGPGGGLIPGPGVGGGSGSVYVPDLTPPPQPALFQAEAAFTHIIITQPAPLYTQGHGHLRTHVYGATVTPALPNPVFADAIEIDTFDGTVRAISSNPSTTWRLWTKWESVDNVLSATPAGGTNGVEVRTAEDVSQLLEALAGQITATELHASLGTPIALINAPGSGILARLTAAEAQAQQLETDLDTRMDAADAERTALIAEVAALSGTPDYSGTETYTLDQIVKYSGGLYSALGTTTGNLPTNATYWEKIGDYASLGDAVAAHSATLVDHSARVSSIEGVNTAQGLSIVGLTSDLAALTGTVSGKASSTSVSQLTTRVTDAEGTIAAQGGSITAINNSIATINNNVATKADANALATLTGRVTATEDANTSQSESLTALQNSITIGGQENLYAGYRMPLTAGPGVYGDSVILKNGADNPLGFLPGEKISLSADIWQDAASAADGSGRIAWLTLWTAQSDGDWISSAVISTAILTPTRLSASVVLPQASDMHSIGLGIFHIGGNASYLGTVTADRIQVERGDPTGYKIGDRLLSSAINSLSSTVTQQGDNILLQGQSIQQLNTDLAGKASTSALNAISGTVTQHGNDITAQGASLNTLSARLGRVVNYRITAQGSSASNSPYGAGLFHEDGTALSGYARSYMLAVFNGATGQFEPQANNDYDVYGGGVFGSLKDAADLAAALNALGPDKVVAVYTYDEPQNNRLTSGLAEAMYRCGASRAVFGSPNFKVRSAYILVGIPGGGEGSGIERYAGAIDLDPNSYCEYNLQLINGRPVGIGGNPMAAAVAANAESISQTNTTVSNINGDVVALAEDFDLLQAAITDPATGLGAKATVAYVDQAKADAIGASASAVQTLQSTIKNGGGNLIENSEFARDLSGWTFPAALIFGRYHSDTWAVPPGTPYMQEGAPNADPNFYYEAAPAIGIPVIPGKRYQFSVYTGAHRCMVQAFIYWRDAAGVIVGNTPLDANIEEATGGSTLAGYKRLKSFGVAPAGAVVAQPIVRKTTTFAGQSSSYVFFTRALFCEATATQTEPDAYSPGSMVSSLQVEATTRATQTGELYAQYTVKQDVGGLISGIGLASTASNAVPTSAFGVQAGQFFVAPPTVAQAVAPTVDLFKGFVWRNTSNNTTYYYDGAGWSTTPTALPFVIQTTPQVINGFTVAPGIYGEAAFFSRLVATRGQIGLLAVDDARIASVAVDKLVAGSIAVGQYAQSTGYIAGSAGWRINGDGTAEFSGVVVRGTIYASQGLIGGSIIGPNYIQSTNWTIAGNAGWALFSNGVGQIGSLLITGSGLESTNYVSGSAGFKIGFNGSMEANNAVFRGTLAAATGTFSGALQAATGSFSGTLSSASGRFTVDANGKLTAIEADIQRRPILASGTFSTGIRFYGYTTDAAGGVTYSPAGTVFVLNAPNNMIETPLTDAWLINAGAMQPYMVTVYADGSGSYLGGNGVFDVAAIGHIVVSRRYSPGGTSTVNDQKVFLCIDSIVVKSTSTFDWFSIPSLQWRVYRI